MDKIFLLHNFNDLRDEYRHYKHKINYYLLKTPDIPNEPGFRQDLTEIGDTLDNRFDEFYLMLHSEI